MRVSVHAVGRMKAGPERDLAARFFDRFARSGAALGLDFAGVAEAVESRLPSAAERRREEAQRLLARIGGDTALFVLDERGAGMASADFAHRILHAAEGGRRELVFAIGGPDGHDEAVRRAAALALSFGPQTWPHQLVRVMLAEQLYRAATILSGHPYHRG